MEVSSTKYDATGMGLAMIPGNPVRTYQRTPYGVIIGGPDGKAPSSRVLLNLTLSISLSPLTGISLPTQPCVTPPCSTLHFRRRLRYPHSRCGRFLPSYEVFSNFYRLSSKADAGSSDRWRRARRSATSASLSVHLALITSAAFTVRSTSSEIRVNANTNTASVIGG
jgi:hypothetical protein